MKREENERMKTKFSTKAYARVHLHNVIGLDETRLHTFYMKFRHAKKCRLCKIVARNGRGNSFTVAHRCGGHTSSSGFFVCKKKIRLCEASVLVLFLRITGLHIYIFIHFIIRLYEPMRAICIFRLVHFRERKKIQKHNMFFYHPCARA